VWTALFCNKHHSLLKELSNTFIAHVQSSAIKLSANNMRLFLYCSYADHLTTYTVSHKKAQLWTFLQQIVIFILSATYYRS